jgi:hypothetical protein
MALGIGLFEKNEVTITSYDIDNDVNDAIITDGYNIERNTSVTGEIYGTLNVFRMFFRGISLMRVLIQRWALQFKTHCQLRLFW